MKFQSNYNGISQVILFIQCNSLFLFQTILAEWSSSNDVTPMDCHEVDQDEVEGEEEEEDVQISESNNPMTLEQFTDIVLASEGMTTDSSDNTTDAASPANGKFTPSRFENFDFSHFLYRVCLELRLLKRND
jgi:hypothetical protein